MSWETRSSINLRKQLLDLQERRKTIEVSYGWFNKSVEEKLNKRKIIFTAVTEDEIKKGVYNQLTSVVNGYPNMVLYKEK